MSLMRFFRRPAASASVHPVTDFWEWWSSEGRFLDPSTRSSLTDELAARVAAIHDGLAWHLSAGTDAEHRLTVSGNGVPELRPVATRWLRAAPRADETWEFRASQEADPRALTNTMTIAGRTVDLSATRFRIESHPDELRISLGVFNPDFDDLPADAPLQVIFLVLDWLLGEDDVERWIAGVERVDGAGDATATADDVVDAVAALRREQDRDEWTLARWDEESGLHGLASFRRALRWVDHPTLDAHHLLHVSYSAQGNGLPADTAELERLRAFESELETRLTGDAMLVAHESLAGRRTFHVYTDSEDQNAGEQLTMWAESHGATVEATHDPAWREVRHFTG
ncbi:DUF695 domain-containing protein [Leifsonia shinshuensis]|uniref:DUF695 domain-containing protein n=1 Tax=Leifsonia shinshuensis TaxID=150026 RepID=UPI001F50BE94|nr:DUF695 domain-containing protein [Leifsonia shinshuensis]MCI0155106.1 DUF695 domain-containing protein [Leifsonia shinshuensis]